ncbi:MAG: restriction endonuclease subunit S, partial [Acidobacteriota bacterium]
EERAQGFKASLLHVRKADITEHIVPLPPLDIQLGIAARSRELSELVNVEQATLESLVRIKRGLTQDLLSGRVRTIRH